MFKFITEEMDQGMVIVIVVCTVSFAAVLCFIFACCYYCCTGIRRPFLHRPNSTLSTDNRDCQTDTVQDNYLPKNNLPSYSEACQEETSYKVVYSKQDGVYIDVEPPPPYSENV